MNVLRRFYEDYGARLGGQAYRDFSEIERALRREGRMTRFLDHVWPAPKPEQVVRRLLSTRERLEEAAEGILDADEQALLRRARSGWSEADLPLVDEARALLAEPPQRFGHVIVDEAQDLTPMQLQMIARRSGRRVHDPRRHRAGDPADRLRPLGRAAPVPARGRARRGRGASPRLPRAAEIMALALPLLEKIAPDVEPPLAYRVGAEPPRIVQETRLAGRLRRGRAALGRRRAARADRACLDAQRRAGSLFDESRIAVLTPREAKGWSSTT